jgi:hypothetical protein
MKTGFIGLGRMGAAMLVTLMLPHGAHADTFSKVYYDSRADQLVVTMIYRGTNPNHTFTLQWGQCQGVNGSNPQEVAVQVLDSQWQDEALRPYRRTVRFSLAGIPCRPAKVTLRTAPRFIYTVLIPAVNGRGRTLAGAIKMSEYTVPDRAGSPRRLLQPVNLLF